jgi:hypothetical protein
MKWQHAKYIGNARADRKRMRSGESECPVGVERLLSAGCVFDARLAVSVVSLQSESEARGIGAAVLERQPARFERNVLALQSQSEAGDQQQPSLDPRPACTFLCRRSRRYDLPFKADRKHRHSPYSRM